MGTHGRDELIGSISRSRAAVTTLVGDSGVGKTTVLSGAQRQSACDGAVAPNPLTVPASGGVLQQALIRSLADAVAQIVERRGHADQIGRQLSDAVKRLAADRGQALASVIGKEILAFARARLGAGVGDALEAYVSELRASLDESLSARIAAASDPGVAGLVLDLAADVRALAPDADVVLSLDAGERLRDEDVRIIIDLAGGIPNGLKLRIAMATHTSDHRKKADSMGSVDGVSVREIPPLDDEGVRSWLAEEGLTSADAEAVIRGTGGYPLHVGDLIAHLKQGGKLEDAPVNQQFANRTREAWSALDASVARHARALCVLADPLPEDRTEALLGLDVHQRAELEETLIRGRMFSIRVNNRPWFHEQRRRFLVEEVLEEREVDEASAHAAEELARLAQERGVDRLAEIAELAQRSPSLVKRHGRPGEGGLSLADALELSPSELAVAGAVFELIEQREGPTVMGDSLLLHAADTFVVDADLVDALESLDKKKFVKVVTDEQNAAVVLFHQDPLVALTVSGRAFLELGRLPMPSVASAVFEAAVQPRLGRFEKAQYGLGHVPATRLAEMAIELRQQEGELAVVRSDPGRNLLVRAQYGGRPVYAAITFETEQRRDAAQEALAGLGSDVFGELLSVTYAAPHPAEPVPSRRFIEAIGRLTNQIFPVHDIPALVLDEELPPEERLTRTAEARRLIRDLCSERERLAFGVEEPVSLAWHAAEGRFVQLEIIGGREGAERLELLSEVDLDGPYGRYTLERLMTLRPPERLGRRLISSGGSPDTEPVIDLLGELSTRAADFNEAQRCRRQVLLERESLEAELTEAARRTLDDARALAPHLEVGDTRTPLTPRASFVAIYLDPPNPRLVPGGRSAALLGWRPADEEAVHVAVLGRKIGRGVDDTQGLPGLQELFDEDLSPQGWGTLDHVIPRLLGFAPDEISFRYSDDSPA